jgi:hypothetical protein
MLNTAICITEGVYRGALTYGKMYEIIRSDEVKRQVKVKGDNGKVRWYPCYCFDNTGKEVPMLTRILHYDSLEKPADWIEVEIELSNGQQRWCLFITPELLAAQPNKVFMENGCLLMYDTPHMIIVDALNKEIIESTLKYIQSQGALLACTKPIE